MSDSPEIFPDSEFSSVLREYLYVDTSMVRGILAQLDSGIDEAETVTDSKRKELRAGFKSLLSVA